MKNFLVNASILVIDDEKTMQDLLKGIFDGAGAQSTLAESGADGFQCLMNAHFDIVLMDLHMPKMDGFECIKAIRQVDPIIPIIVITGYATQENIRNFFKLGANDYFAKPFDMAQITKRADELIREKLDDRKI